MIKAKKTYALREELGNSNADGIDLLERMTDHAAKLEIALEQSKNDYSRLYSALATLRNYHNLHNTTSIEKFVDRVLANNSDEGHAKRVPSGAGLGS